MHRKILLAIVIGSAPLLLGACTGNQPDTANAPTAAASPAATPAAAQATPAPATQPQPVNVNVEEVQLAAGGAGEAVVRLDIAEGFHVNANPASDKFYVATEVQAEP